eukprot:352433-Amphidinium_carterae.4
MAAVGGFAFSNVLLVSSCRSDHVATRVLGSSVPSHIALLASFALMGSFVAQWVLGSCVPSLCTWHLLQPT